MATRTKAPPSLDALQKRVTTTGDKLVEAKARAQKANLAACEAAAAHATAQAEYEHARAASEANGTI